MYLLLILFAMDGADVRLPLRVSLLYMWYYWQTYSSAKIASFHITTTSTAKIVSVVFELSKNK